VICCAISSSSWERLAHFLSVQALLSFFCFSQD
jgi:hypothetical protein